MQGLQFSKKSQSRGREEHNSESWNSFISFFAASFTWEWEWRICSSSSQMRDAGFFPAPSRFLSVFQISITTQQKEK